MFQDCCPIWPVFEPADNISSVSWFPFLQLELYAFVENFNKENRNWISWKCICSPSGFCRECSQSISCSDGGLKRADDDSLPVFTCKVVREKEERPESMSELLHRSLLTRSLSPWRDSPNQQKISEYGIPPPVHTFPHEILIDHSKSESMVTIQKDSEQPKYCAGWAFPVSRQREVYLER